MHLLTMYIVGFIAGTGALIWSLIQDQSLFFGILCYLAVGSLGILATGCLFAFISPPKSRAYDIEELEDIKGLIESTRHR